MLRTLKGNTDFSDPKAGLEPALEHRSCSQDFLSVRNLHLKIVRLDRFGFSWTENEISNVSKLKPQQPSCLKNVSNILAAAHREFTEQKEEKCHFLLVILHGFIVLPH